MTKIQCSAQYYRSRPAEGAQTPPQPFLARDRADFWERHPRFSACCRVLLLVAWVVLALLFLFVMLLPLAAGRGPAPIWLLW